MPRTITIEFILLFALAASDIQAQTRQVRPVAEPRRLALVIGNDAYPDKRLNNAVNDARSMRDALTSSGFTVDILTDRSLPQLEEGIDKFVSSVRPGDIALVYYSGHGIQIQEQNYLIPVDFTARTAADAKYKSYPVQRVIDNLEQAGVALQIVILDACRDNPYRSIRGGGGGLATMNAGQGVYIALATAPGKTASDNPGGRNGLFTGELVKSIRQTGLSIDQVFNQTRARVSNVSHREQVPWSTSSLVGEFYFSGDGPASVAPDPAAEAWERAKSSGNRGMLEAMVREFPDSSYARLAKVELAGMTAPVVVPPPRTSGPKAGDVKLNSKDGQRYVWIPPGDFKMGCSDSDNDCYSEERPTHDVTITKGFWLGQTPITVGAWKLYRSATEVPAHATEDSLAWKTLNEASGNDNMPVVFVTWEEVSKYCRWGGGRLPTEAEWERAARAGGTNARYGALDHIAWYADNSGRQPIDSLAVWQVDSKRYAQKLVENGNGPHPVGLKQPNAWNLYDILGNVWQWTADWYSETGYRNSVQRDPLGPVNGDRRVLRGGSWSDGPAHVRVSVRGEGEPAFRKNYFGGRCVVE